MPVPIPSRLTNTCEEKHSECILLSYYYFGIEVNIGASEMLWKELYECEDSK